MNLDDIIKLAGEAGLWLDSEGHIAGGQLDSIPRFAALVAAAEREACAKLCEWKTGLKQVDTAIETCAAAIRAREQE
jgi:hypothetical protein